MPAVLLVRQQAPQHESHQPQAEADTPHQRENLQVQGQQKTQSRADRDGDLAPLACQFSRCEAVDPDRAQPERQRMERVEAGELRHLDIGWPEGHEQAADPSGRTSRYGIGPPEHADHRRLPNSTDSKRATTRLSPNSLNHPASSIV
jgi:hypothetical protein